MIQANELRIGNYVAATNDEAKFPYKITATEIVYANADPDRFKPIHLTEEWLLKFGFIETSAQEHRFELKPFVVYLWLTGVVIEIGKEFYETDNKYVHQLQNLYFTLTGKELEEK